MNAPKTVLAVIDTNVLVSALLAKSESSNPARLIEATISGTIVPVYNDEIIDEYREVLARKKFRFNQELVARILAIFTSFGFKTDRKNCSSEYFPDPDDVVFYEVAMSIDDAYLVTGNIKHFPVKPLIVTPSQMIKILTEKGLI